MFLLGLAVLLTLADALSLFSGSIVVNGQRKHSSVFSLGDEQQIGLILENKSKTFLRAILIDELPVQLQVRDFLRHATLPSGEKVELSYMIRPLTRGVYGFGYLNVYIF